MMMLYYVIFVQKTDMLYRFFVWVFVGMQNT